MDLAEFSNYFSLDKDTQDFIVKYGFNEVAGRLEDIPESLSDKYILNALSKLRQQPDVAQILAAAAELRENRFLERKNSSLTYQMQKQTLLPAPDIPRQQCDSTANFRSYKTWQKAQRHSK